MKLLRYLSSLLLLLIVVLSSPRSHSQPPPCTVTWQFTNVIDCQLVVTCNGMVIGTVPATSWGTPQTRLFQIPCGCNPTVQTNTGQSIFTGNSGTQYLCCGNHNCITPNGCARVVINAASKSCTLFIPPAGNPCP